MPVYVYRAMRLRFLRGAWRTPAGCSPRSGRSLLQSFAPRFADSTARGDLPPRDRPVRSRSSPPAIPAPGSPSSTADEGRLAIETAPFRVLAPHPAVIRQRGADREDRLRDPPPPRCCALANPKSSGPSGRGMTNREIAAAPCIAPGTVRKHLDNTYAKLGVRSRAQAVAVTTNTADRQSLFPSWSCWCGLSLPRRAASGRGRAEPLAPLDERAPASQHAQVMPRSWCRAEAYSEPAARTRTAIPVGLQRHREASDGRREALDPVVPPQGTRPRGCRGGHRRRDRGSDGVRCEPGRRNVVRRVDRPLTVRLHGHANDRLGRRRTQLVRQLHRRRAHRHRLAHLRERRPVRGRGALRQPQRRAHDVVHRRCRRRSADRLSR